MTAPTRRVFSGQGNIELVADMWGSDQDHSVLLLHGGGQTRQAWGSTGARLADAGWQAVALDLRGHGDSGWAPDGDYSWRSYRADVVRVADELGHRPVMVGASLGGATGLMASVEPYERSRGLILVDIVPRAERQGGERIRAFMRAHLDGFDSPGDAARAIAEYLPHRGVRSDAGLEKVLRRREDGRWYWHWDPAFVAPDRPGRPVPDEDRMEAAMAALTVPVLLVRGALSDVVTETAESNFLEQNPSAESVVVPGAAHMVAGDSNAHFTDAVMAFLARFAT